MRILFMGTGRFAVPTLEALLSSEHEVIGVVTQPDRPAGRGRQVRISPVKESALALCPRRISVYQPERVRSEDFVELVKEIQPDVIVVAAFGQIIPKAILDIPKYGNVNVHASLLPKYRGAAPVHHALFNGEIRTGITTMLMDPGLDTGPILLQKEVEILPEDNEGSLEARLARAGAELLLATLKGLEAGDVVPKPQDSSAATYAPSVKREDCQICWDEDAHRIVNLIRGCTPRPGAYAFWQGSPLKVWNARVLEPAPADAGVPGEIIGITSDGVAIRAGRGAVLLTEVQPENRKRMPATEFSRGYRISRDGRFT